MGLGRKLGQTLVVQRRGHGCVHLRAIRFPSKGL